MNVAPRIELEDEPAARLEALPAALMPLDEPSPPRWGTAGLAPSGVVVLALGLAGLSVGNFVADQFARAAWLGWITLGVAGAGFGLMGIGVWRELRGLAMLRRVDELRAGLASGDAARIMASARAWSRVVPGGAAIEPALQTVNDPDAAIALLRAGPAEALQDSADRLGRIAAVRAVAGIAAIPQALFTYQATLHLSAQQIWFIAYILAYKWTADLPFPSLHRMAERTGYSRRQIQNIKDSLVAAGFLQIIPRVRPETGRDTNGSDFSPLFAELSGLQQAAGS